jgi:hypothetical protein
MTFYKFHGGSNHTANTAWNRALGDSGLVLVDGKLDYGSGAHVAGRWFGGTSRHNRHNKHNVPNVPHHFNAQTAHHPIGVCLLCLGAVCLCAVLGFLLIYSPQSRRLVLAMPGSCAASAQVGTPGCLETEASRIASTRLMRRTPHGSAAGAALAKRADHC